MSITNLLRQLPNGTYLTGFYDSANNVVQYDAYVQPNSWIAIGYGSSMTNTDMVYWGANGNSSLQEDLYSTTESRPAIDTINSYTTNYVVEVDNSVHFTSTRSLDPNTSPEDYVIVLDEWQNMVCAWETTTYALGYHSSNRETWVMMLMSDGTSMARDTVPFMTTNQGKIMHGFFMWTSWTLIGLLQIISGRYLKHKFTWRQNFHSAMGFLLFILVLAAFITVF